MIPALGLTQPPSTEQVLASLRGLYYDLAGHAVPKMLDALLLTTDVKHLLYGSDWPFTSEAKVSQLQEQLATTKRFDAQMRLQLARTNALSLLPRLQAALSG
jgi:predicted TIM-barrel fold metal-dependent hydrolase